MSTKKPRKTFRPYGARIANAAYTLRCFNFVLYLRDTVTVTNAVDERVGKFQDFIDLLLAVLFVRQHAWVHDELGLNRCTHCRVINLAQVDQLRQLGGDRCPRRVQHRDVRFRLDQSFADGV